MNITQQLLHQLGRGFGRLGRRAVRREPLPDRHFATRLRAGGAANILPGQGGHIGPEPRLRIPFELEAGDGEVKVVVFSDPPGLLTLEIEMPDGTPLSAAAGSRGSYAAAIENGPSCACSFELPAAAWPPAHGTWLVVLSVDTERFKEYLMEVRGSFPREFERLAASGVYYSVSALAARRPAPSFAWRPFSLKAVLPEPPRRERRLPFAAGRPELVLPLP